MCKSTSSPGRPPAGPFRRGWLDIWGDRRAKLLGQMLAETAAVAKDED
jgi:hypothetical protein